MVARYGQASPHSTNRDPDVGRIRVEDGRTAYIEGRGFRAYHVFSGDTVLRFEVTADVDLTLSAQHVDVGAMRYRVFVGGTEGGVFDTTIPSYPMNLKTGVVPVDSGVVITTGGTLDTAGATQVDESRLKTSAASGQRITVANSVDSRRGFGPGVFYVVIDTIPGASQAPEGVLDYEWSVSNGD